MPKYYVSYRLYNLIFFVVFYGYSVFFFRNIRKLRFGMQLFVVRTSNFLFWNLGVTTKGIGMLLFFEWKTEIWSTT